MAPAADSPAPETPVRRRVPVARILVALGVVVLGVVLARRLDLDRLLAAFRHAAFGLVALAALTNLTLNTVARVGRWKALLRPLPRTGPGASFSELTAIYFASQAASNLLPARAGEALRVVQLHRRHGYPIPGLVMVQLVETLVGAVTLGVLTLPMVPLGKAPASLSVAIFLFALAGPVGMVALLVLARLVPLDMRSAPAPAGSGRIPRGVAWVRGLILRLLEAVRLLGSFRVWAPSLAWSLLSDFTDVLMIGLVLSAVGVSLPPASWVLIYAGINLVLLAPTTPAQIGVLEVGAVAALGAFGVDGNAALAFALLYHAAHVVPPTLVGGILLPRLDTRTASPGSETSSIIASPCRGAKG
jgi:glycosyltransferase AglD